MSGRTRRLPPHVPSTRLRVATAVALALCATAACGGPDQETGERKARDSSAPESPVTPSSDADIETDFSDAGNPEGWPLGKFGQGSTTEIREGTYRATLAPNDFVQVGPKKSARLRAERVTATIHPTGFDGGNATFGLSCMRNVDSEGNLGDGYFLLATADGLVAISKLQDGHNRRFSPPLPISGWDPQQPRALVFTCESTNRGVRFSIAGDDGTEMLGASDSKNQLPAGLARVELLGDSKQAGTVAFDRIELSLDGTSSVQ